MIDFVLENWQMICSLAASLANFVFALLVHKRSSRKISKITSEQAAVDDAFYQVLSKTFQLIEAMKGVKDEEKTLSQEEQKTL